MSFWLPLVRTVRPTDGRVVNKMAGRSDSQAVRWSGGQTDGQPDGRMVGGSNGQAARQSDEAVGLVALPRLSTFPQILGGCCGTYSHLVGWSVDSDLHINAPPCIDLVPL
jgi:hypothetical protein